MRECWCEQRRHRQFYRLRWSGCGKGDCRGGSTVVNEARHEGVLVEQEVALDVTATYDEAKPQDLRLRAQSKDEEDKVALDGAKPQDRRLRAQSKGRDDKVAHDGAKPQDLQRRARSNGREAL